MEWTGARYADNPTVQVRTWIDASPRRVWELVSDVQLMPTMSEELQSIEWLDGFHSQLEGRNGGGHPWRTDGRLAIAVMHRSEAATPDQQLGGTRPARPPSR